MIIVEFFRWILRKFFRKEINPFSVSDKAVFRNVDKTLTLFVRSDAASLVVGIKKAYDKLATMTDERTEEDKADAARMFAYSIFGKEQGDRLCEFYADPLAVITACGMYFKQRLAAKITKAQKK